MTHPYAQWRLSLICAAMLTLTACTSAPPEQAAPSPSTEQAKAAAPAAETDTAATPDTQASAEKLKFKRDDGSEAFSIKFRADGAKLVDGDDQEIARFTLDESGKVKIKDPSDAVLGYVITQEGYWKVENAEQTQELFILRAQDDGDYKLEDGSDAQIYRIKQRDYGYEVETPDKTSLYKVKLKDGKLSLRDANEVTVMSTQSPLVPIAMACFGFDVLTPEQQAALAYAVNLAGGQ
ncbi:MAG: hypothetical protein O3A14_13025 [Cyanobacteria bacterium]|nr:hypothetical protein [Cyanobacteriota bacterium]